jgi:hypothetical protein
MPKILIYFILTFCLTSFFQPTVYAQRVEIGINMGAANYVGDLAPSMVMSETKFSGGLFGRYNISSSIAFTGSMNISRLAGSDQNVDMNKSRNLSFRSNISEFSGVFEFNYFKYGLHVLDKTITSYVFLGIGVLNFNPQAFINNQWVDLQNIQTEGVSYNTACVIVPFGMGFKWRLSKHIAVESSIGFRKTYSDRIDDVSSEYADFNEQIQQKGMIAAYLTDRSAELNNGTPQFKAGYRRGNDDFNDWYMIANVSLSCRIFSRLKCARFY